MSGHGNKILLVIGLLLTACQPTQPKQREQLPIPLESDYDMVLLFYSSEDCGWCTRQKKAIEQHADAIEAAGLEIRLLEGTVPFDGYMAVPYNVLVVREQGTWWIEWKHVGYLSMPYLLERVNEISTTS